MTNPIQAQIERIPSGIRRMIIAVLVIALLAFLFPLSDSDRYNGSLPTPTLELTPAGGNGANDDAGDAGGDANTDETANDDGDTNSEVSDDDATTPSRPRPTATPRFTATPAPTATPRPTSTPCAVDPDWTVYVVQRGDTLDSIARLAESTVQEVLQGNCILNPNRILPGQAIFVPSLPGMIAAMSATPPPTFTPTFAPVTFTPVPTASG